MAESVAELEAARLVVEGARATAVEETQVVSEGACVADLWEVVMRVALREAALRAMVAMVEEAAMMVDTMADMMAQEAAGKEVEANSAVVQEMAAMEMATGEVAGGREARLGAVKVVRTAEATDEATVGAAELAIPAAAAGMAATVAVARELVMAVAERDTARDRVVVREAPPCGVAERVATEVAVPEAARETEENVVAVQALVRTVATEVAVRKVTVVRQEAVAMAAMATFQS